MIDSRKRRFSLNEAVDGSGMLPTDTGLRRLRQNTADAEDVPANSGADREGNSNFTACRRGPQREDLRFPGGCVPAVGQAVPLSLAGQEMGTGQ